VIALVYVNDGLFLGADKALVDSKKCACLKHWECCDTGDVTDFLGMKVNKTASCIMIDQKAYLEMVLERFNMHNAKIAPTPIPSGYVPQENKGVVDPVQHQKFQSVIRSLLYLMLGTHLDIAFTVIKVLQFSANPSQDHLNKAIYIMHYLVGTQYYHMVYDGRINEGLIAQLHSPPLKPNIWLCWTHVDKSCGFSPCSRNLAMIWCPHLFVATIKVQSLSDQIQSKNGGQSVMRGLLF